MTYRGKIRNGVVVLESPAKLPEGTEVIVQPVAEQPTTSEPKWRCCVGTISEEEALQMLAAIEESCERIDPEPEL